MSKVILDDHLLRDLLVDDIPDELAILLVDHEPATTNLYLYRLTKSVVSARGGALTGAWRPDQRRALGSQLMELPPSVTVVPMQIIAFRMAEVAALHRVSTLGAECVAAAEHLGAVVCVWSGDDGPGIRAALGAAGRDYRPIER